MGETPQTRTLDTQLFYDAFKASPIGIAVENLEGQPLFVNPALCSMLGFSEEEMHRKHCVEFSPPEDSEKDWALFQQLRAGSIDHYQIEKRYFRRDGSLLWARLSISFLNSHPAPLILALVEDITEKKTAQERERDILETLRASEERLRLAQQIAYIGTFEWNIQTGVNTWTPELEAMYGLPRGGFGGTQTAFENLVHPDDRERIIGLVDSALKTGDSTQGEWRVVWPDGSLHWIAGSWRVFMDESGKPSRMIGVNKDVTDSKRAEEALLGVNGRLIEAQEQERTRIGRELHDDLAQRIALLAIEIEQLEANPSDVQSRLLELRTRTFEIADDVQALSHELHSAKLEYLGVVPGIKSWCKEFAERQKAEIDFTSDVLNPLPFEIGLCLFRILQEALHNAVKHSGVKRIEVQVTQQHANEVHLVVSDSGKGFDVEAAMRGKGLGLISMRERVRLVNGTISIESKPMGGTVIRVRVPFEPVRGVQQAAG